MSKPVAYFDSHNFEEVPGLTIVKIPPRPANRDLQTGYIPGTDKSATYSARYKDRKLNITIEIGRDSRELFDDSLDVLMGLLNGRNKELKLPYGSTYRIWTATYSNMNISDVLGGHGQIELEFLASDPIGIDISSTQIFSENVTSSSSTKNFVLGGSFEWQKLLITLTLNSVTGATNKTITIDNPATGQTLTITSTFANGDVLVIDGESGDVTLNGTPVEFSGIVPDWEVGAGSLLYSDNFTTRNRTLVAEYYKRYS